MPRLLVVSVIGVVVPGAPAGIGAANAVPAYCSEYDRGAASPGGATVGGGVTIACDVSAAPPAGCDRATSEKMPAAPAATIDPLNAQWVAPFATW